MVNLELVILLLAMVMFALAAVGIPPIQSRVNLIAVGLALLTLFFLVRK
jgi:hypothetical protein